MLAIFTEVPVLLPLVESLQKLVDDGILQLSDVIIEIAGSIDTEVLNQLEKYQLYQQINFIGIIQRKRVLEKLADSHLLWLIVGEGIDHSAGIPLKSFEYIESTDQFYVLLLIPQRQQL